MQTEEAVQRGKAPGLIWWAMCAGPVAWACDLGFSYVLEQHTCSTGHHYVLHVISIVCVLIALSGFLAALAGLGALPKDASDEGERPRDRTHFQVLFGMVFSLAFTIVVIAGAVPRWILHPCM
jgi:hypothetical protein